MTRLFCFVLCNIFYFFLEISDKVVTEFAGIFNGAFPLYLPISIQFSFALDR